MKVTIKDIAKAANVAKSTVSKVINDSPKISSETKRKVRDIMERMNYTPSSIATKLAKRSGSLNIGLLIDMSQESAYMNPHFQHIMLGIESVIGPLQYELTIANVHTEDPDRHFLNRLVRTGRVDGLIANNAILTSEMADQLEALQFPYVSMGEYVRHAVPWVDFDNENGGRLLTDHLLSQGYRRIAFVGGEAGEALYTRRYAGYADAMRRAGEPIHPAWDKRGIADEGLGRQAVTALLRDGRPPDAVVCMNNYVAFGALKAAQQAGVQVPGRFGIATFDDYPFSPYTSPPLTSLRIDTFELGAAAARLLMERIDHPEGEPRSRLLQPEMIVRESTFRNSSV